MASGDCHHGHHHQQIQPSEQQNRHHPRSPPEATPHTAPAAPSARGAVACFAPTVAALCGLAGILITWIYCHGGGAVGLRPQEQQTNGVADTPWFIEADGRRGTRDNGVGVGGVQNVTLGPNVRNPQLEVAGKSGETTLSVVSDVCSSYKRARHS